MTIYYKFHHLIGEDDVKNIYAFIGNENPEKLDIFEDKSKEYMERVVYVNDIIYPDDTIEIVKRKLVSNIPDLTYPELHMFCVKKMSMTYREFTTKFFTKKGKYQNKHLKIMMSNLLKDDDNRKYFDNVSTIGDIDYSKSFKIYKSVDKVSENEFMNYVVNPFTITDETFLRNFMIGRNNGEPIINYNIIENNELYFCDAETLINKFTDISPINIIKYYFPLLVDYDIKNMEDLKTRRDRISDSVVSKYKDDYIKITKKYHEFQNLSIKSDKIKKGLLLIEFEILNIDGKSIPFDIIFKNINATIDYPIVKTVVNKNMERYIKLYTERTTKSGMKIPLSDSSTILKTVKIIPNKRGVYVYSNIKEENDGVNGSIILGINDEGNIYVKAIFEQDIPIEKCESILKNHLIFLN